MNEQIINILNNRLLELYSLEEQVLLKIQINQSKLNKLIGMKIPFYLLSKRNKRDYLEDELMILIRKYEREYHRLEYKTDEVKLIKYTLESC